MPFMRKTKREYHRQLALNVVRYSELAAFDPSDATLQQFDSLHGPFRQRADRRFARAVCEAIAAEARVNTSNLDIETLFVICAIAVHRHRLKLPRPPDYYLAGTTTFTSA